MAQETGIRQQAAGTRRRSLFPVHCSLRTSSAGLTLIELVVSVSILVLVSTILLVGAVSERKHAVVRSAAHQVAGFLRETGNLALNGVKAPGCPQQERRECSQYRVTFQDGGNNRYSRRAEGGGATISAVLPAGAVFSSDTTGATLVKYEPPIITTDPPGGRTITIQHASGSPTWLVCVRGLGSVEVRSTGPC